MKLSDKKLNFVIDYALCYLFASWDDYIQEDLNMEYKEFVKLINKFKGNEKPYKPSQRDYDY